MFETIQIKIFGKQPTAKVTDQKLQRLIQREFGAKASEVKQKLQQVESDTDSGKNRISAAILKLSNRDFNLIDYYVEIGNQDFRDLILRAEYPRCSKFGFGEIDKQNKRKIFLQDWKEYSEWLSR